jgi:hypothetical protein
MASFEEHGDVLQLLQEAQDADHDNREVVRTVHHFLDKPDGQWEPDVSQALRGRPRYTFDRCNDIVDSIAGHIESADFGIKVKPAGGEATQDIAKIYDGLIRNIQNISSAPRIYTKAARNMVAAGLSGWEVVQDWGSDNSFDQDLLIRQVPNWVDTVWFDATAVEETMEDAKFAFKLKSMAMADYEADFPKGSKISVSDARTREVYHDKASDTITIGSFYYKDPVEREIVEMTNGAVYVVDEKFESIEDELAAQQITVKRRRTREIDEIKMRLFDGGDWLNDVQDTVFQLIPLIPDFGNFKISENKVIYWGVITKKMDAQRVFNYARSRQIEEGALAPREKVWMTRKQAESDTASLETMNVNADPVQFYTPDDTQGALPPFKLGGPQINPGLSEISASAQVDLRSGIDVPGQPVGLRSGVAVELEQDDEDIKDVKYFGSQEVAICYTAKVMLTAIPKIYDARRQIRVLGEDGKSDMVTLNDQVFDQDTNEMVEINDLSQGVYDVTCIVGPAFKNRQSETTASFLVISKIDPSILQGGKDIWLNNINTPGMSDMAERARVQLIQQGQIPFEQMTDEEKTAAQQAAEAAANQPPPQDPLMIAAQAELVNSESLAQERLANTEIERNKLQMKNFELQLKEMDLDGRAQKEQNKFILDQNAQQNDNLSKQISSLADLIKGFGIEALGGAAPATLIAQQGSIVNETQDAIDNQQ